MTTTQTTSQPVAGQAAGAGANQQNIADAAAFARRARRNWWRNAISRWQTENRRNQSIAAFHALPDSVLRDIGVSRCDILLSDQDRLQRHGS